MARQEINGRPIIWRPQPRQAAFMRRSEDEALYGGAAGGGKSDALVIEALRQVDVPNYRALILRKTFPQLRELIDKTMQYYKPVFPKARYNASNHCWTFPSGAKIYFGSMFRAQDKYNYQGQQFDFIGHTGVHPGHGQPRRHRPRVGEGPVHHAGTPGHPDGAAGGREEAGRLRGKAAAHAGVYPLHHL